MQLSDLIMFPVFILRQLAILVGLVLIVVTFPIWGPLGLLWWGFADFWKEYKIWRDSRKPEPEVGVDKF